MKTKKYIAVLILLIVLVLVIPIPTSPMKEGGTRVYAALTYKVVKWHRLYDDGKIYVKTKVYLFPNNYLSIDDLFEKEMNN